MFGFFSVIRCVLSAFFLRLPITLLFLIILVQKWKNDIKNHSKSTFCTFFTDLIYKWNPFEWYFDTQFAFKLLECALVFQKAIISFRTTFHNIRHTDTHKKHSRRQEIHSIPKKKSKHFFSILVSFCCIYSYNKSFVITSQGNLSLNEWQYYTLLFLLASLQFQVLIKWHPLETWVYFD